MNGFVAISIAALVVLSPARAAGPHPKIKLDWDRAGEVLTYQSCGCADSCWTAELKRGGQLKENEPYPAPHESLDRSRKKLGAQSALVTGGFLWGMDETSPCKEMSWLLT